MRQMVFCECERPDCRFCYGFPTDDELKKNAEGLKLQVKLGNVVDVIVGDDTKVGYATISGDVATMVITDEHVAGIIKVGLMGSIVYSIKIVPEPAIRGIK